MEDFFYRYNSPTVVQAHGEDAEDYLQSQWTIDIRKIKTGQIRFGLRLTSRGKILAGSYIARMTDEEFLLIAQKTPPSELIKMMEENVVADEVEFSDQSENWELFSLHLANSTKLPFNQDLSSLGNREYLSRENGICWMDECMPEGFYSGLFKKGSCIPNTFSEGLEPISEQRFDTLRIQSGNFSIPDEIGNEDLPQEAGAEKEMVDFNKGCYLGQEVMARLHSMGKVQRRVLAVRLECDSPISPNLPMPIILDNKQVGVLKSLVKHENSWTGVAKIHLKAKERLIENGLGLEEPSLGRVFML